MATVIDYVACKQCNGTMYSEFSTRTMGESNVCQRCGYQCDHTIALDENGEMIRNSEGQVLYKVEEKMGYGSYLIKIKNGVGSFGVFTEPITDEVIESFREHMERDDIDKEKSYLIRLEGNKIEMIFGSPDNPVMQDHDQYIAICEAEARKMDEEFEKREAEQKQDSVVVSESDLPF